MICLVQGDARRIPLADGTVQCVVTSPPYWGLRKYAGAQELVWGGDPACAHQWGEPTRGTQHQRNKTANKLADNVVLHPETGRTCLLCGAWRGAFGLEPSPEMYVRHTVEILREVRRVLRDDGLCFWNVGDSYNAAGRVGHGTRVGYKQGTNRASAAGADSCRPSAPGLKPKDLCLIPARVAIAAQEDGWFVRSDIIWSKPNVMPSSVKDRPTASYEHVIMLAKSEKYFWDAFAVAEPAVMKPQRRLTPRHSKRDAYMKEVAPHRVCEYKLRDEPGVECSFGGLPKQDALGKATYTGFNARYKAGAPSPLRNIRDVWVFPTQAYREAHFATFPEELPRRCIKAATSWKGACRFCGAPWARITRKPKLPPELRNRGGGTKMGFHTQSVGGGQKVQDWYDANPAETVGWQPSCKCGGKWEATDPQSSGRRMIGTVRAWREVGGDHDNPIPPAETVGWKPTCKCGGETENTVPQIVLDPFAGSGTTGAVAQELGRSFVGLDLAYHSLARVRIERGTRPPKQKKAKASK